MPYAEIVIDGELVAAEYRMEVCPTCLGEGTIPDRRLSPTGDGSWTGAELAEFHDYDCEMADEYFRGEAYTQNCPGCDGKNVVRVGVGEHAEEFDSQTAPEPYGPWWANDPVAQAEMRVGA